MRPPQGSTAASYVTMLKNTTRKHMKAEQIEGPKMVCIESTREPNNP